MKINRKIILSLFIGAGVSSVAWYMEGDAAAAEGQITLVSAEDQSISISREAAKLSIIVKNMLEDFPERALEPIPVPNVSTPILNDIVRILSRVKSELTPRRVDGRYAPYKVQPIVDAVLSDKSFEQIKDTLLAADYLDIPLLINAAARALVIKDLAPIPISEPFVERNIFAGIPDGLHIYIRKHIKFSGLMFPREYSIADLIEEHPEQIILKRLGQMPGLTLALNSKFLTSLYGIKQLNKQVYEEAQNLFLTANYILDHEHDPDFPQKPFELFTNIHLLQLSDNQLSILSTTTFNGLVGLETLYLSDNQLGTLPVTIFKDLGKLKYLYLDHNKLKILPEGTFNGLDSIQMLNINGNLLSEEQKAQIRAFFAGREVEIVF